MSPPDSLNESLHLKLQNKRSRGHLEGILICLIESPYKKEGKCGQASKLKSFPRCLNESPLHEGREILANVTAHAQPVHSSMKVPTKKQGNVAVEADWTPVIKPQ